MELSGRGRRFVTPVIFRALVCLVVALIPHLSHGQLAPVPLSPLTVEEERYLLQVVRAAATPDAVALQVAREGGEMADTTYAELRQQAAACAALLREAADKLVSLLKQAENLVEINDVDVVTRVVDIGPHLGVPAAGGVTKMEPRLEQVLHSCQSHEIASIRRSAGARRGLGEPHRPTGRVTALSGRLVLRFR